MLCVLCLTVLVNCFFNAFAICMDEVIVVNVTAEVNDFLLISLDTNRVS